MSPRDDEVYRLVNDTGCVELQSITTATQLLEHGPVRVPCEVHGTSDTCAHRTTCQACSIAEAASTSGTISEAELNASCVIGAETTDIGNITIGIASGSHHTTNG